MRANHFIAIGLAIGAGVAIGRATAPSSSSSPVTAVVERGAPTIVASGSCVAHLDDDDLRRVRDEVIAAIAPAGATGPAPLESPPDQRPTPAQLAAEETTARLIDTAIAAGRWTDADAAIFHGQLGDVPEGTRMATLQRMIVAINSNKLRVETTGSPF